MYRYNFKTLIVGCVILIVAVMIIRDQLQNKPLPKFPYSQQAFDSARKSGRPVLIFMTARWDASTYQHHLTMLQSERLKMFCYSRNVSVLQFDITSYTPTDQDYMKKFGISTVPTTLVFCPEREEPIVLFNLVSDSEIVRAMRSCENDF